MKKVTASKEKLDWERTGKTVQELSVNKKGVITLAEEKAKGKTKEKTRLVAIGYTSIIAKPKEED